MSRSAKSVLSSLLLLVGFMLSCGIVLFPLQEAVLKKDVGPQVPENFPVLVVSSDPKSPLVQARIVFKKDLGDFLAKNPDSTYLVPAGQEERLNDEVAKLPDLETGSPPFRAGFMVTRLAEGRQALRVHYDLYDDMTRVGWYEATENEIFPKSQKAHGDIGLLIVPAFFINLVLWAILYFAYVLIRRWRKKAAALQSTPPGA